MVKRGVLKIFAIAALTGVIGFSVFQVSTPVVRADGCPSDPFPNCECTLTEVVWAQYGDQTHWWCTYSCYCHGTGGVDPFYVERNYDYWQ